MKRSRCIIIFTLLFLAILAGCKTTTPEQEEQTIYKENIAQIEQFVMKEESYLFNDEDFTIYFPYEISFINNIQKVQLYLDNELVQSINNQNEINTLDTNKLILKTNGKNKSFNNIIIFDGDNNKIKLKTGKFVFDGKDNTEQIPEQNQIYLIGSSFKQNGTNVTMKYELTRVDGTEVLVKVPDSLIGIVSKPKTRLLEKKEKSNIYEITFELNKTYYEQRNIFNISFEVISEQVFNDKLVNR
ncbi:hypothetical protein [Paenibacillus herberti]|uniref:Lipoprotein n=1 Tax=Paenibacillus herberti TaxID=1619309 RepID=A0A229P434_9BACL|nr:hypothetical protein [Paenibacillus herberti]OXM16837.1 hypothetical protein CGZ75_09350 [Paenibacillus herberti]